MEPLARISTLNIDIYSWISTLASHFCPFHSLLICSQRIFVVLSMKINTLWDKIKRMVNGIYMKFLKIWFMCVTEIANEWIAERQVYGQVRQTTKTIKIKRKMKSLQRKWNYWRLDAIVHKTIIPSIFVSQVKLNIQTFFDLSHLAQHN